LRGPAARGSAARPPPPGRLFRALTVHAPELR
jgi:hypothetical protein